LFASLIDVPELKAWPGVYRNPLLFLDGDPGPVVEEICNFFESLPPSKQSN
jgi:hypothetical protein